MPVAAIKDTTNIRTLIETAIGDLLHNADDESVNLRRESRRVFEGACLDESLWASWVDEWIDLAYDLAGEHTNVREYESLTDWCVCGHSDDDHRLDCQNSECDCARFKRSRCATRPKQRKASKVSLIMKANRSVSMGALEAVEIRRLFGDLTGGAR